MRPLPSALAFALVLGWCAVASPQEAEKRALRFAFAPGTKVTMEVETTMAMAGKGGPQAMTMSNDRSTTYALEIGEAAGEGRFKAKFGALKDDVKMNGKSMSSSTEAILADVVIDTRGRLVEVVGADPELAMQTELPRKELEMNLLGGIGPFPEEPVGVGSTWTRTLEGRSGPAPMPMVLTNRVEALGPDGAVTIVQTAAIAPGAGGPPTTVEWRMTFVLKGGLLESSEGTAKLSSTMGEKSMTVDLAATRKRVAN